MAANAFDILLRFVLDKKTLAEVHNGTKSVQEALAGIDGASNAVGITAMKLQPILEEQNRIAAALQNSWWRAQRQLKAAQFVMTQMVAVGAAMSAPIVKFATDYIKEYDKLGLKGDETVERWKAAMNKIKGAELSVGKTAVDVLLPTLEKVAVLAENAAAFVEKNPDIIRAALETGAVLITLGTIGTLLIQGIKLVVDVKFVAASVQNMAASALAMEAAKVNLKAALIHAAAGEYDLAQDAALRPLSGATDLFSSGTVKKIASYVIPIVAAAVLLYAGAKGGEQVGNWAGKKVYGDEWKTQDMGDAWRTFRMEMASISQTFVMVSRKMGFGSDEAAKKVWEFTKKVWGLTGALENAAAATSRLEAEAKAMAILQQLNVDDSAATAKYEQDRVQVINDANESLAQAAVSYSNAITSAANQYYDSISSITASFQAATIDAEAEYAAKRAEIIANAGEQIEDIERDLQERLRQLALDHADRMAELTASRDALGLVQEQRKYEREREEEIRAANIRIAEIRQDIAQQLAEAAAAYAREEAQRRAQYERDLQEAAAQYSASLSQASEAYTAERKQILEAQAQKLKDLQKNYEDERRQRVAAALAAIRELGNNLYAERLLRSQYQTAIYGDFEAFVAAMLAESAKLRAEADASASTSGKASGGYVGRGRYTVGEEGYEFVTNHSTTKALEAAVHGRLTQSALLGLAYGGKGNRLTYIDQRRFDSSISIEDRRQIVNETLGAVMELIQ